MTATAKLAKKTPAKRAAKQAPQAKAPVESSPVETTRAARDIAEATVVLELRINAPGFRRKMRSQDVMTSGSDADPELFHVRKDLIDPKALEALGGCRSRFIRWLNARSVSCSMLKGGMRLIPLALVNEVDVGASAFKVERATLAADLVEKYVEHKANAKQKLGSHYVESDYPSAEDLAAAFSVRVRFLSFNVPAALEGLNRELYERERQRVEAEWAEAGDEIRQALGESFAGLVEHLAERLGSDDGKPRTFRDNTIKQMQEFIATFAARDLTGDGELANLARQAGALLDGVNPDDLRKKELVRDRVREGTESIKAALDKMQVVPKVRKFAADGEV